MEYPKLHDRIYVNPSGNVAASGFYRSHLTQYTANMLPPWMHFRDNPRSVGQNFINPMCKQLEKIKEDLSNSIRDKYISTIREDEVDVLYRMKLPSNIDLTDATASGVRCLTAPSSGPNREMRSSGAPSL